MRSISISVQCYLAVNLLTFGHIKMIATKVIRGNVFIYA